MTLKAVLVGRLRWAVRAVLARPRLKQWARRVLLASPRLYARVSAVMLRAPQAGLAPRGSDRAQMLSPRAHQLYLGLQRARNRSVH